MSVFLAIVGGFLGGAIFGAIALSSITMFKHEKIHMQSDTEKLAKLKEELKAIRLKNRLMKEEIEKNNIERSSQNDRYGL